MTEAQTSLFEQPRHDEDRDVAWLEATCVATGDWITAAELLETIGRPGTEDNKRWIRELASRTPKIISGQKGYKHIEHGTAEEVKHAVNTLESQAKKMGERAQAIRRNAHRIFG